MRKGSEYGHRQLNKFYFINIDEKELIKDYQKTYERIWL